MAVQQESKKQAEKSSKDEEKNKVTPSLFRDLQKIEKAMSAEDMPKDVIAEKLKNFLKSKDLNIFEQEEKIRRKGKGRGKKNDKRRGEQKVKEERERRKGKKKGKEERKRRKGLE